MSYIDDLKTARDNLATELKNETARRKALTVAGDPAPTTYSFSGRNFDWNGYLRAMTEEIGNLNKVIGMNDLYEEVEHGWL